MALFRLTPAAKPPLLVAGQGLYLRAPQMSDHGAWAELRRRSRAFLEPWEPAWADDELSASAFSRRVRRSAEEIEADQNYPLLIFRNGDDALLGGLTLGQIRRGVSQAGTFGYWIGAEHARRGHMSAAVAAALRFGFGTLRLNRIEAACLPENAPSIGLLLRAGFQREGLAREYLCIAGVWRDHVLFARLARD